MREFRLCSSRERYAVLIKVEKRHRMHSWYFVKKNSGLPANLPLVHYFCIALHNKQTRISVTK